MLHNFLLFKYVQITFVISLYWIVSILTVFVNKTLLSDDNINAPIFVIWFQCLFSVVICLLMKFISMKMGKNWFPEGSPFEKQNLKNVLPVTMLFALMIVFNSLCLKYVGVSFYYIGRSLTTVFNVILTFAILGEKVSQKVLICCVIIVIGFLMGVNQENVLGTLSITGTIFGMGASLSLALYSIYTKKVLPLLNHHIWLLSYYNNVYSSIALAPIVIFNNELNSVYNILPNTHFWILMSIGGLCGFSIGYVTSLQIKVTSPLTHNVSGTAKASAQTVLASFYYLESKTALWWISNAVILSGSAAYTYVKQKELQKEIMSKLIPHVNKV